MTQTEWNGFVMRSLKDESGSVPRIFSADSPDIVNSGLTKLSSPDELKSLSTTLQNPLRPGMANFIYLRAENTTQSTVSGVFRLYSVPVSLTLFPKQWTKSPVKAPDGSTTVPISAGASDVVISDPSYLFAPSSAQSLIAIADSGNGVPDASKITTLPELAAYVSNNADIAMSSIVECQSSKTFSLPYSQGYESCKVNITVSMDSVPAGSTFKLSQGNCSMVLAEPLSGEVTQENGFETGWQNLEVPANWSGTLDFSIAFGGAVSQSAPVQVKFEVSYVQSNNQPVTVGTATALYIS